ncbi:MAG: TIGR02530 family flagellar biosynthesis protein [Pseudomonadota bacterium]
MSIQDLYRAGSASITPSGPGSLGERPSIGKANQSSNPEEFQKILRQEESKVSMSQHAETRIRSREIPWSPALEKRVMGGIEALEAKGSREALILADDVAFIANIRSKTIVTAMDRTQLKERVFTNIDSAVLV